MRLHVGTAFAALALGVALTTTPAAASTTPADVAPVVHTIVTPTADPAQWGGTAYPWSGGTGLGWGGGVGLGGYGVGGFGLGGSISAYPWPGGGFSGTPSWVGYPGYADQQVASYASWGAAASGWPVYPNTGGQFWGGWAAPWWGTFGVPWWGPPVPPIGVPPVGVGVTQGPVVVLAQ